MTLACEYCNTNIVEVITVDDIDAEIGVDDRLVDIKTLKLAIKLDFCTL